MFYLENILPHYELNITSVDEEEVEEDLDYPDHSSSKSI